VRCDRGVFEESVESALNISSHVSVCDCV
jgi:hypothetical protein